jgi:PAS domain S-box-containing protein
MAKRRTRALGLLLGTLLLITLAELIILLWSPGSATVPAQGTITTTLLLALAIACSLLWRHRADDRLLRQNDPAPLQGYRLHLISLSVLLLGLQLTAAAVYQLDLRIMTEASARYDRLHERLLSEIQRRFTLPVYGLRGAAGSIIATGNAMLNPQSFRSYVASRDLKTEFPGVRGFGFIQPVRRTSLPGFLAREAQALHAAFPLKHPGDTDPLYIVRFIEPIAANREAWGYDLGSEPVRRAAITHAIERGKATMTGSIRLLQDQQGTPGYLILVPVMAPATTPASTTQPVSTLLGLVYAPVILRELMAGVNLAAEQQLDYTIFDSTLPTAGTLVYEESSPRAQGFGGNVNLPAPPASFSRMQRLDCSGRTLTIQTRSSPRFETSINRSPLLAVAAMGGCASLLAALACWLLLRRQQGAEQLAASMTHDLARMAKVAEHTTNAIIITDSQRRITWVNEGFTRLTGYSLDEVRQHSPGELLQCAQSDPQVIAQMRQALDACLPFRGKLLNRNKTGTTYWVDIDIQPIRDKNHGLDGFMAIESDITQQEATQADLRSALLEAQTIRDIIQQHFIVSIANPQGRITSVNRAFTDISGYSLTQLLGQDHRLLNAGVHPPAFWQTMWRTVTSGQPWRGEVCNRRQDGSLYWVDSIIAPFFDTRGRIESYVSIRRDITASKAYEASLQEAKHQAEQASQAKSRFLANMSHEIRTPMNAILGLLQLLQHSALAAEQRDYVDKTEAAARSLLGLLNDILDFSKVEAGKMTLDVQPFRLDQLMHNLSVLLSASNIHKPLELIFAIEAGIPPWLMGDAMRLQQVLVNLAGNAIKFTEQGEVILRVGLQALEADTATLAFSVQDSGIGMSQGQQDKLFHSFSQAETSTTRRFGGTGLGLAISQRIVQLMGGEIQVSSQPGQGSCFSFTLQLALATTLNDNRPIHSSGMPILIVDDNPVARAATASMASQLGWQATCLASGEEVMRMLAASQGQPLPYKLVLIDWHMPGQDGWATCRELRRHDSEIKMIMVTSHGQDMLATRSDRERSLLAGFLVKPLTPVMLGDAVRKLGIEQQDNPVPLPQASTGPVAPLAGLLLLLVEDNATNRLVAKGLLGKDGAQVDVAENGEEAVRAVAKMSRRYDAILMDLQMPVMDGLTAAREIRQTLGEQQLPIIAMTANAMQDDRQNCLAAGMNDHIGKPFAIAELRDMLLRHIAAAQAGR